jgi:hypothetical protein
MVTEKDSRHKLTKDISNDLYMTSILKYLEILMSGRVKPNKIKDGAESSIRDTYGELNEIAQVKNKLADIFRLDTSIVYNDDLNK